MPDSQSVFRQTGSPTLQTGKRYSGTNPSYSDTLFSFNLFRGRMRTLCLFVMVVLMNTFATSQTLATPQAITDPKQITSKPDARVEKSLSIEKLFMTRQVGGSAWSPDGKTVAFVS